MAAVLGLAWALIDFATAAETGGTREVEQLHDACRRSDLEEVRALLAKEAIPNLEATTGMEKRTALLWAVQGRASRAEERCGIVAELLRRGAKIEARAHLGEGALELACAPGWEPKLLELLLQHGAAVDPDPKIRPATDSALHRAVALSDEALARFLIAHRANPKATARVRGDTPLMRVFASGGSERWRLFSSEKARESALRMASLLLEAGADLHAVNTEGETALHCAAAANHLAAIRDLLSRGAKADARASDGRTVLHHAVSNPRHHDRAVLQALQAASRLPIDVTDQAGNTLLHRAVRAGNPLGVQSLLLMGAKANARNKDKKLPADMEGYDFLDRATQEMLERYSLRESRPGAPDGEPPARLQPNTAAARAWRMGVCS